MARVQLEADSRPIQRAERDLRQLNATGARTESVTNRMTGAYRVLGGVLTTLGAARFWGMVLSNTIEQERVTAQLEATLRSTGRYTPELSRSMQDYASSLQQVTAFGDEAIIASQALLLTFTQVGEQEFPRAQEAILDVATAMGTDLRSAAQQVGRALNDPIQGLAALSRSGIQFSQVQRDNIRNFVEMGDIASAQRIILGELETQFGGSARAARNTLGGAIQSLKNAFGDLLEGDTDGQGVNGAVEAINKLTETLNDPEVQAGFQAMVQGLFGIAEGAAAAVPKLIEFNRWANESTNVVARAGRAYADYMQWLYGTALASKDATEAQEELNEAKEEVIPTLEGVTRLTAESNRENQALTEITNQLNAEIERLTYSLWGEAEAYETVVAARNAGVDLYSEEGQRLAEQIDKRNQLIAAIERQESALSQFNQLEAQMQSREVGDMEVFERLRYEYEQRLSIIQEALDKEVITHEQAEAAKLQLEQQTAMERDRLMAERERSEMSYWQRWLEAAERNLTSFDELSANTIDHFSRGFGDAFADIVTGSEDATDAIRGMMGSILTSTISALGQMGAQWLAYQAVQMVTGKATQAGAAGAKTAEAQASSMMAGLNAFSATAAIPVVGPALAPGAMAAALAATQPMAASVAALMATSVAARRNGGFASGSQNILVGEAGPEIVRLPQGGGRVTSNDNLMRAINQRQQAPTTNEVNINFEISAVDATGIEQLLASQRDTIYNLVADAMREQARDL